MFQTPTVHRDWDTNGAIYARLWGHSGLLDLGGQLTGSTSSSPAVRFFSVGGSTTEDASVTATGGTGGTADHGTLTAKAYDFTLSGGSFYTTGTTPTMGVCGTTPSISGTDVSGVVTVGSGTVTSCTVNFSRTMANARHGVVLTPANATAAAQGTTGMYVSAPTTTGWVINGAALAGAAYTYHVE